MVTVTEPATIRTDSHVHRLTADAEDAADFHPDGSAVVTLDNEPGENCLMCVRARRPAGLSEQLFVAEDDGIITHSLQKIVRERATRPLRADASPNPAWPPPAVQRAPESGDQVSR